MPNIRKYNTKNLYFFDRIMKELEGVLDYPLTIVEAPMGYGKTTAIREYLNNSDCHVLWQRIDDSDKINFWKGFCHLIYSLDPECSENLIHLGFPNDSISKQEAFQLIKQMKLSQKTVLVLDDYHHVNIEEVDAFIKLLVTEEIDHLYIVLITRFIKFNNMEEIYIKGFLYYLTKNVFTLRADEIKKYFKVCGINLTDSEADKLYFYTEGWIGALYLLMMDYNRAGGFEKTDSIYKLLEKAIYDPFSSEIKEFLITISVFETFTLEQAIHMWQKENAGQLLDEIISKNALVTYDLQSKTYQFHNIFTHFLKNQFDKKNLEYKQRVFIRTADWYLEKGDYLAAMNSYYMAEDFHGLFNAIEADKGHSIHNEQKEIFIQYFETCPDLIKQSHPIALLIYGLCLFSFNEAERFERLCGEFISAIESNDRLDKDSVNELMGEFELLLNFTCYNNISQMMEHVKKASKLLTCSAQFIDTQGGFTFGSPSILYMFYREAGTLEKDVELIKEAMPFYHKVANGHAIGAEFVMEAERLYNLGDLENAEIISHKACYLASQHGQGEILICAMFLQARIALYKGDYSVIQNICQQLSKEIKQRKWYNLIHTIDLCETFIYCSLKANEKIPSWIMNGDFNSSRLYFPAMAFLNIVYGRALLISGEHYKLLGIADHLINTASIFPNLLGQIYSYIHIACANERIHRKADAFAALQQALDIAIQDQIYMPFVENCDYIGPMLMELQLQGNYRQHATKILELNVTYQKSLAKIRKGHFTKKKPELSERELEIAKLAAEGFSNREIGEKLYISQNTVKTLLKRIFEKLEINSRALLKQNFNDKL